MLSTNNLRRREVLMARIAPSAAFDSVPMEDLGQGDRINLGVAAIFGHRPEVAGALGSLKAALQASGTLPPRLVELVQAADCLPQPVPELHVGALPECDR